jgi:hypothetical protein
MSLVTDSAGRLDMFFCEHLSDPKTWIRALATNFLLLNTSTGYRLNWTVFGRKIDILTMLYSITHTVPSERLFPGTLKAAQIMAVPFHL